ncbi:MAG: hypothetical protein QOH93_3161 [Chloroflexia bacterium]|jgi:hypothetical protein|nr:hypothetical protein [Chloroflexia bacterium]
MFRQGIEALGLWIEQDTPRTPKSGRFYVFRHGRIVGDFSRKERRLALEKYNELRIAAGGRLATPSTARRLTVGERESLIAGETAFMATYYEGSNPAKHIHSRR